MQYLVVTEKGDWRLEPTVPDLLAALLAAETPDEADGSAASEEGDRVSGRWWREPPRRDAWELPRLGGASVFHCRITTRSGGRVGRTTTALGSRLPRPRGQDEGLACPRGVHGRRSRSLVAMRQSAPLRIGLIASKLGIPGGTATASTTNELCAKASLTRFARLEASTQTSHRTGGCQTAPSLVLEDQEPDETAGQGGRSAKFRASRASSAIPLASSSLEAGTAKQIWLRPWA